MRTATLTEVASRAADGEDFDTLLADFLDGFYGAPTAAALTDEPMLLAPTLGVAGRTMDAYLAAVSENLAQRFALQQPTWIWSEARRLRRPWFAMPAAAMRAILLVESPAAFRSRNLFVSENALSRV